MAKRDSTVLHFRLGSRSGSSCRSAPSSKNFTSAGWIMLLVVSVTFPARNVQGAAGTTVTAAAFSGNPYLSADKSTEATGSFTTALTGPILKTNSQGSIGSGTLILNVPTGYVWDDGGTTPSVTGSTSISFTSVSATQVTFTVTTAIGKNKTITFSNLRVKPSSGFPLAATGNMTRSGTATLSTESSTNYGTLTEVAGAASKLVLSGTASSTAGANSSNLTVTMQDAFGNSATRAGAVLVMPASTSTGEQKAFKTTGGSVATSFAITGGSSSVSFQYYDELAGIFDLSTSNDAAGPFLTNGSALRFTVNPASADHLAFVQQPTNVAPNTAVSPPVTVQVQDSFGNSVPGVRSISLALAAGSGVLSGTIPKDTDQNGLATFSDLILTQSRLKTLTASSLSTTSVDSASFTVNNNSPSDIGLSRMHFPENQPSGSEIGAFTSVDPDSGDTFTYTLVTGTEDTDNGSFTIVGDKLKTNAIFNFENQATYRIRVRSADDGNPTRSVEKVFTILVKNTGTPDFNGGNNKADLLLRDSSSGEVILWLLE